MDPGSADTVPRRPHHRIRRALPAAYSDAPPEHHLHHDAVAQRHAPDPRSARYTYERGTANQGTAPMRYAAPTRHEYPHQPPQNHHDAMAAEYYPHYDARASAYRSTHPPAYHHDVASQPGLALTLPYDDVNLPARCSSSTPSTTSAPHIAVPVGRPDLRDHDATASCPADLPGRSTSVGTREDHRWSTPTSPAN